MAAGTHWEWRAFGPEADVIGSRFADLDYALLPHALEDLYVWSPGLNVNIKVRAGALAGLKFKRFQASFPPLELWLEDPAEYIAFPVGPRAWESLAAALDSADLSLASYPAQPPGREETITALRKAGCKLLQVSKVRESWWWRGPNGRVLVEQTRILHPQRLITIALESEDIGSVDAMSGERAIADLLAAIPALIRDQTSVTRMNYMDALTIWASGNLI